MKHFKSIIGHKTLLSALLITLVLGAGACGGEETNEPGSGSQTPQTIPSGLSITFGNNTITNGQSLYLGEHPLGQPIELIFSAYNNSDAVIRFTQNPTVFISCLGYKITQELPKSLQPSSANQFTILYNPESAGTFNCDVKIYSDAKNAKEFIIKLSAKAVTHEPKIDLHLDSITSDTITDTKGRDMPNGTINVDIGKTETKKHIDLKFTIFNRGSSKLTLNKEDDSVINLSDTKNFAIISDAAAEVAAGGSTTFLLRYAPVTIGTHVANITIESDDPNNSTYSISLVGTSFEGSYVDRPEISVSVNNSNVVNTSQNILIGSAPLNEPMNIDILIKNVGTANLHLTDSISLEGDSSCFAIAAQPSEPNISPNESLVAKLIFTPTEIGRACTKVSIPNDDADEANFYFTICGEGYKKETAANIKGYVVELHQNVGKSSYKKITYTFQSNFTAGNYIVFARAADTMSEWSQLFNPVLKSGALEKVSLYWRIFDEKLGTWESNDIDDVVLIKDPSGKIIDKAAVSQNVHKTRVTAVAANASIDAASDFEGTAGSYAFSLTTAGANNAPDPLTNGEADNTVYKHPIYIYEIGERGKNSSLGGTTQLNSSDGNYVMFYLPIEH